VGAAAVVVVAEAAMIAVVEEAEAEEVEGACQTQSKPHMLLR
jgi:hypothetical protein